ncbi:MULTISPECIES: hypothetical protein [Azospirillum]|uniref:Uncharacterized protein n=2 Tax=Azospirillum brasilense TaxID=192 RepID=A0ABU4PFD8_AZOBR|nr:MULTISPECIES: hypothetical protein [Azospirillum]ALJ39440.1 hypothetical protein AMK58_28525 [Azospirillum brasilense]MDX5955939.1 hypothetical protein [Azospirillum brasilense]PWC82933.1 hypothetical protein AEJ54_31310 [Azospirillum sp. Sp 7]
MTRYLLLVGAILLAAVPAHAGDHWSQLASAISAEIARAEALARDGKPDEARKTVTEAYFGLFESEKMEAALRKEVGSKHAFDREKQFGDLRKLIAKGTLGGIRDLAAALQSGLAEDGKALDAANVPAHVFAVNQ